MRIAIAIHERFNEALIWEKLRKTSQNSQQCKCHNSKKATTIFQEEITSTLAMAEETLLEQDQRGIAYPIVEFILLKLWACLGPKNKKCVMERILSNPSLSSNMLNCFLPPKAIVTTQKLVARIRTSLVETKQDNFNAKLVVKHCILTIAINANLEHHLQGALQGCLVCTIEM